MEIARLVLDYLGILTWPAVAALAVIIFRKELSALVARIRHVKLPGGAEINLDAAVKDLEIEADRVDIDQAALKAKQLLRGDIPKQVAQLIVQKNLLPSQADYDLGYYLDMAEHNPNLALAGVRMEIERMLQNMLSVAGIGTAERYIPISKMLGFLRDVVPPSLHRLLRKIIDVANAAIHREDMTCEVSSRFIDALAPFFTYYFDWMMTSLQEKREE